MNMAREYMVKKFLGEIKTTRGRFFRVFSTGRPGWVLLAAIDRPGGMDLGFQVAYPRKRFKRGVLPPER